MSEPEAGPPAVLPRGALIVWWSGGSAYSGFVVGTCSWDNAGADNAYVVRYIWTGYEPAPRRPYAVVRMDEVCPATHYAEEFNVGGDFARTPPDRCTVWQTVARDGLIFVEPKP